MFVAMPTAMPAAPFSSRFGSLAGSTVGSLKRAIEVGAKIDGVLIDVEQQLFGDRGQARLGVAHRRRRSPSTLPKLPWPSTSG